MLLICTLAVQRASAQYTELMSAANNGDLKKVRALLAAGANVDGKGQWDWTPLMCAKDPEIVKVLLAAGADASASAGDGSTALVLAMQRQDQAMVQLLKSTGAK
jgi:ankyrin repeat protein